MKEGRVRVKMCGMTNEQDISQAISLGADALGVILYPGSKRFISLKQAKLILGQVPLFVDRVAVMVNPSEAEVKQVIQELPIQLIQFHGEESPDFCNQFNIPYIKAISALSSNVISSAIIRYKDAAAILVDTPSLQHGGTGQVFDWSFIPTDSEKPLILAGGLTSANVEEAIAVTKPYAVDVCSGIERANGLKDKIKMAQFINAVNSIKE